MARSIGMICLCLYLLVVGILLLTNITIVFAGFIEGALAVVAAICLFLGR